MTSATDSTDSCHDRRLQRNDFHNKNQLVRVFAVGKFHRYLKEYLSPNKPLTQLDIRLLKGFYSTTRIEIEKEHKRALLTPMGSSDCIENKNLDIATVVHRHLTSRIISKPF